MKRSASGRGTMFRRLFVQITSTVLFCYIVSSFLLIFFFSSFWKSDIYSKFEGRAAGIVDSVKWSWSDNPSSEITDHLEYLTLSSSEGEAFITDGSGRVIGCADMLGENGSISTVCPVHSGLTFPQSVLSIAGDPDKRGRYEGQVSCLPGSTWFLVVKQFESPSGTGYYVLVTESSETAYVPYTTEFLRMVLFAGMVAVLISFFASITVSYRMSKPIKKVNSATRQYAGGDFSVKIPEMHTYDELETLIESVNVMADSLSVLEQSRSNFISNVSHELKTPMTIIGGYIDGILDGTIGEQDTRKYLTVVSDEVKRLSRLIVAMLNMSKIEAGKLTLKPVEVKMDKLIFSVLVSFEKAIESKKIEIMGLDTLENLTFMADDALINQVIYNLVDNAVKFTPEGGEIRFSLYEEKKTANIIIRNTGDGIPTEEAALIFDRFYKVDKSRRLDTQSFGMGLYIVRNIIELHSGTVTAESEPGKFTEFHIRLPM